VRFQLLALCGEALKKKSERATGLDVVGICRTAFALATRVAMLVSFVVWIGRTAFAFATRVAMLVRLIIGICRAAGAFSLQVTVAMGLRGIALLVAGHGEDRECRAEKQRQ
jgi:hypothetical protein